MSIIELDQLYNSYVHPFIKEEKNFFFLINLDTKETLLKSEGIENYDAIKNKMKKKILILL